MILHGSGKVLYMFKVNKGLIEPNRKNIYKPIATIHQHKTRYSSSQQLFYSLY